MECEANVPNAFDAHWYRSYYPDVDVLGMDPLNHYIWIGQRLGRAPNELDYNSRGKKQSEIPLPARTNHDIRSRDLGIFISGEGFSRPGFIYRIERHAIAVARCGLRVAKLDIKGIASNTELIKHARFVFIWRAAWDENLSAFIDNARSQGVPVIFDTDDLMVRPELAIPRFIDAIRFNKMEPSRVQHHYARVRQTMKSVDFCTASTAELAWEMRRDPERKPTLILPNGFSEETYHLSRTSARKKATSKDGLIRIGYASGGTTHQVDFRACVGAVSTVLTERADCRLVLFRRSTGPTLDVSEYPELSGLEDQIEWRSFVDHHLLPTEIARFDINLAPLEIGNPFCEAKSELKFFEAAICDVPTIASPTGPFARAIDHGESGFLASTPEEWLGTLRSLVDDVELRRRVGREAHRRVLWTFGPLRRIDLIQSVLDQIDGGPRGAAAFCRHVALLDHRQHTLPLADRMIVFEHDDGRPAKVSVIVPLFNYESYITDGLASVACQTLDDIELIVVDDCSTDHSAKVALEWMDKHRKRFRRIVLAQHKENQGLGASRNTAFDLADTLHIMTLDADNRLLPACCERLLCIMDAKGAAFVYPTIRQFGDGAGLMGNAPYRPAALVPGNYIDAMAMISKEAWALVGGYSTSRLGWQDYDLWCRFAERGLHGAHADAVLAEYRVHQSSMLRTATDKSKNKKALVDQMEADHPWLSLLERGSLRR